MELVLELFTTVIDAMFERFVAALDKIDRGGSIDDPRRA
jgi:hypothetical protein